MPGRVWGPGKLPPLRRAGSPLGARRGPPSGCDMTFVIAEVTKSGTRRERGCVRVTSVMKTTTDVQNYASGDWRVRSGAETDFIARWSEFLQWTRAEVPGFLSATLIRDAEEPAHFVSFAEWDSLDALLAWRRLPEFAARMGACQASSAAAQAGPSCSAVRARSQAWWPSVPNHSV